MAIHLSSKRCEEIKQIVVDMFVEYDVTCVPINGFEIAKKMGITVIPYSAYRPSVRGLMLKESIDGFSVELDDGRWYIFYNDQMGYGRTNNTIMHEIAHIVLDHTEESELAEAEVRFFAKYALVPPVLVHRLRITTASEIVRIFDVSGEAAGYAMQYYRKWLSRGRVNYTPYEMITLRQFKISS